MKKLVALLMSIVLICTTFMLTISASSSIDKIAIDVETFSTTETRFSDREIKYFKVVVPSDGDLTIQVSGLDWYSRVMDKSGSIKADQEFKSGYSRNESRKVNLTKGTYYLQLQPYKYDNNRDATIFLTFTPETEPSVTFVKKMKKGTSEQLKIETKPNSKVIWKTGKKSIATVSTDGTVKAVGKVSTYIYAELPNGQSEKIKIVVS